MPPTHRQGNPQFPGMGERIRIAMRAAGHGKFAALAHEIGVSESSLSRWCNGHDLSLIHAVALARSLNVSLDWLITGAGPADPQTPTAVPDGERLREVGRFLLDLAGQPAPSGADAPASLAPHANERPKT